LRLGVHDLLDEGEQAEGAAREAVDARHRSPRLRGRGCRAFREAEYSALPKFTNGEAIVSTGDPITVAPRAFAPASRDHISGPCTLTFQTKRPPL
jgi:hypothetical protein